MTEGKADGNSVVGNSMVSGGEIINQINPTKGKNQTKITKSNILIKSKNRDFPHNSRNIKAGSGFFTPKARLVFTQLRQKFVEASIFYHFDLECHIWIEFDTFGYAIGRILS